MNLTDELLPKQPPDAQALADTQEEMRNLLESLLGTSDFDTLLALFSGQLTQQSLADRLGAPKYQVTRVRQRLECHGQQLGKALAMLSNLIVHADLQQPSARDQVRALVRLIREQWGKLRSQVEQLAAS